MADERRNADIARRLELQPDTVKSYAKNIRRKLGVSSRQEAVAAARLHGLLD
jgi:DNA-binding CsgD family transcriptional regulator